MKQPKKLTREQKECLSAHYLNCKDWMMVEETEFYDRIINKLSLIHILDFREQKPARLLVGFIIRKILKEIITLISVCILII